MRKLVWNEDLEALSNQGEYDSQSSPLDIKHTICRVEKNKRQGEKDPAFGSSTKPVEFALYVVLGHDGNIVRALNVLSIIGQSRKNSFTTL